jgi:hypothetical protein
MINKDNGKYMRSYDSSNRSWGVDYHQKGKITATKKLTNSQSRHNLTISIKTLTEKNQLTAG